MTQRLDTPLTRLGAARAWLLAACRPCAVERLSLAEAQGAFAAAEIRAPRAAPPVDVAVADGVAVASADCLGAAPTAPALLMQRPPAVEAGDALPPGTDAVLDAAAVGADGPPYEAAFAPAPGDGVRRQGEDAAADARLAAAGERLTPWALLACGLTGLTAVDARRPRVALIEIPPREGDGASGPLIAALLAAEGARLRRLPAEGRESPAVAAALRRAAAEGADLVVTLGGAGQGAGDHLRAALPAEAQVHAHGLALAPGRSALVGRLGDVPLLALPGRFDGALAALLALGLPALRALAGAPPPAPAAARPLTRKIASTVGLAQIALLENVAEGWAPLAVGDISAAHVRRADAYALVDEESEGWPAGASIAPWPTPGRSSGA